MSTPPTDPAPKPGPPPSHQPDPPADQPKTDPRDEPKFSQADVDRIIAGRLAPVKEKADAYDKQIEAAKTDAQRQQDTLEQMRAENAVLKAAQARRDAATAANLPASAIGLVTGDTPEQIDLSVKAVQALTAPPAALIHCRLSDAEHGVSWVLGGNKSTVNAATAVCRHRRPRRCLLADCRLSDADHGVSRVLGGNKSTVNDAPAAARSLTVDLVTPNTACRGSWAGTSRQSTKLGPVVG